MTISVSRLQYLLSQNEIFRSRLLAIMTQVALEVLQEQGVGETHAARAYYARTVLQTGGAAATAAALFIAQSTNVRNTITMEDVGVVSSVSDAALASQVSTLWNTLAGIDEGN